MKMTKSLLTVICLMAVLALNSCDGTKTEKEGPLFPVKDGNWGFINAKGEMVIEPQYYDVDFSGCFNGGLCAVQKEYGDLWGYIDCNNKMIIKPEFELARNFPNRPYWGTNDGHEYCVSSKDIANVNYPGKEGEYYINNIGKMVIDVNKIDFENYYIVGDEVKNAQIANNLKIYMIIDSHIAIITKRDSVYGLESNRFEKWGLYDLEKGKVIVEPKYDYINSFSGSGDCLAVSLYEPRRDGVIDKTGKEVLPLKYDYVVAGNGEFYVWEDSVRRIVDNQGHVVADNLEYDIASLCLQDSYSVIYTTGVDERDRVYGYIDRTGKIVIKPQFTNADEFENGLAHVEIEKDGKLTVGYINTKGEFVWSATADATDRNRLKWF